jgi:DNA processing protein
MNARLILFALHEMEQIGWKTIFKILQCYPNLTELRDAKPQDLELLDIRKAQAKIICQLLTEVYINERLSAYEKQGIEILTIYDDTYPALLKQTSQPPWVLYYKGNIEILRNPLIAIVGTRVPTVYGKNTALQFAATLARTGFTVVSGLARGIDSSAHTGAINETGSTIAVLGCGVDVVFPSENGALYREIAGKGLLLSEFPLSTPAQPGLFPLRNRIIAGLSLGTLVVEAALKSGSLITADQALEESRDVFAIPGPINSPKSLGTLSLIKQGAKMVVCAEDIMEEYKHFIPMKTDTKGDVVILADQPVLNEAEQQIVDILTSEPATFDHLLEETQTNFGHLHTILLSLVMKNKINQLPGSSYSIR